MKYSQPNCNRCDSPCAQVCSAKIGGKIVARRGRRDFQKCTAYHRPSGKFMLAELALAHPQSLHDSLCRLPFEVNLDFYLK